MADITVASKQLLKRVVGYYRHSLSADSKGLKYLRDHLKIHHNLVIEDCQIGYSDGSLVDTLPEDPSIISHLQSLGILDKNSTDKLKNHLVVPLTDASGEIVNMFVRNVNSHRSRLLWRSGAGVINYRAFMAFDSVIITPTVFDLLVLYDQGVQHCAYIYCGGDLDAAGVFHQSKFLKHVFIAKFKAAGRRSCHKHLPAFFEERGIAAHLFSIPTNNAAVYFSRHTVKDFITLFERQKKKIASSKKLADTHFEPTQEGFNCIADNTRRYQIKGIDKKATQLKLTLKACLNQGGTTPFELSTVDMYSYRARIWFARLCADLFAVSEDIVQADLHRILDYAERMQKTQSDVCIQLTEEEEKEAMAFLNDPKLMERILDDFDAIGVVGEQTNKLVGYLAAVSRKLDDPLSVLIQSRSAAGKSTLQDGILALVPPEDVFKYTRITDQALFYSGENTFAHKVLAIEEGPGMKGAAYSIRNIQSSGKITIAAAGKTAGDQGLKTRAYTVKGPLAVMLTTTVTNLDEETASRFIVLTIDESASMTRAIHDHHRQGEALNGILSKQIAHKLAHKHHNAQRLLKPVLVINPYAVHLTYPTGFLKARRDFRKYLGLIKAITFLHQYQRERQTAVIDGHDHDYIQVTLTDIERANELAADVMGQSPDDLPVSSRQLLRLIFKMVSALAKERGLPVAKISITRRMIREYTGWSNWQVRNYLPPLVDFEYLVVQSHSCVNHYRFAVNTGENRNHIFWSGLQLTSVAELKQITDDPVQNG